MEDAAETQHELAGEDVALGGADRNSVGAYSAIRLDELRIGIGPGDERLSSTELPIWVVANEGLVVNKPPSFGVLTPSGCHACTDALAGYA